jgi:hypothetical protein
MSRAPDWSGEILRSCLRFEVDFRTSVSSGGSVAVARHRRNRTLPDRPLTVDEVVLLTSLKAAGHLPPALREQISDCDQLLARLVLDGLVEVRRDGRFQSGVAALQLEAGGRRDETHGDEPRRISELALEYALAVRHLDPSILAERLYAFNSLPTTRPTQRDASAEFALQTSIDPDNPVLKIGSHEWTVQPGRAWLYFRRGSSSGGRFKIYLSPRPQDIPHVIRGFAEVLGSRTSAGVFKIAFPSEALRRPDKIVAYVPTFNALQETLSRLVALSLDATVQAVPFSAPVPRAPLLSWGVDPPNESKGPSCSWRSWLTRQLAECAHVIPLTEDSADALSHLKVALRLRNIDPVTWLPRQQLLSRKWRLEL